MSATNRLADILQAVIDGKVKPDAAVKEVEAWKDLPTDDLKINNAWHTLVHYNIDEDIRNKDVDYDEDIKKQLRAHIEKLKSH